MTKRVLVIAAKPCVLIHCVHCCCLVCLRSDYFPMFCYMRTAVPDVEQLDPRLVKLLATQRLQQIVSPKKFSDPGHETDLPPVLESTGQRASAAPVSQVGIAGELHVLEVVILVCVVWQVSWGQLLV